MKREQVGFLIFGGLFCVLILSACPTPQKPQEDQFAVKMKQKWAGKIVASFEKNLKPNVFAGKEGSHDSHKKWALEQQKDVMKACGVCHPGGNPKHLPPMPNGCYECHDQKTKIPFRGLGPKSKQ